jgi:hypothetical protein
MQQMKRLIKVWLSAFCLLLFSMAYAADSLHVVKHSGASIKKFRNASLENFRKMEEFRYDRNIVPDDGSWWNILKRFLSDLFNIGYKKEAAGFWEMVFYVVMILFLAFLVWRLLNADKSWFLYKSKTSGQKKISAAENIVIDGIDFQRHIDEAIDKKDFRTAIRYFYLHTLKMFSLASLIAWREDKTNYEYYKEIRVPELKEHFFENTKAFDYIWYGDFYVDDAHFEEVRQSYHSLILKLNKLT